MAMAGIQLGAKALNGRDQLPSLVGGTMLPGQLGHWFAGLILCGLHGNQPHYFCRPHGADQTLFQHSTVLFPQRNDRAWGLYFSQGVICWLLLVSPPDLLV
jgi:hypothetical protein